MEEHANQTAALLSAKDYTGAAAAEAEFARHAAAKPVANRNGALAGAMVIVTVRAVVDESAPLHPLVRLEAVRVLSVGKVNSLPALKGKGKDKGIKGKDKAYKGKSPSMQVTKAACKFFLKNKCAKGNDCMFRPPPITC